MWPTIALVTANQIVHDLCDCGALAIVLLGYTVTLELRAVIILLCLVVQMEASFVAVASG